MQGSRKESEAAFTEIYDRYAIRVNAYCRTILNDREKAEDIFQETFLRFYKYASSERKTGSVIGFIITIARNLCLNAKRDDKFTVPIEEFKLSVDNAGNYEDKEMSELLMMALDLLPSELKEVMVLRYFDELRYNDIAEILNITAARARYLVYNGKQKIKEILTPYLKEIQK